MRRTPASRCRSDSTARDLSLALSQPVTPVRILCPWCCSLLPPPQPVFTPYGRRTKYTRTRRRSNSTPLCSLPRVKTIESGHYLVEFVRGPHVSCCKRLQGVQCHKQSLSNHHPDHRTKPPLTTRASEREKKKRKTQCLPGPPGVRHRFSTSSSSPQAPTLVIPVRGCSM